MKNMFINSQVSVQREILVTLPTSSHGPPPVPFVNDLPSRTNFLNLNRISITFAGRYDRVETVPNPIKQWHKASKGATERFSGSLADVFPELKDISEKELKRIQRTRHDL